MNTQQQVIAKIMDQSQAALRGSEDEYLDQLQAAYQAAQDAIAARIVSRFGAAGSWTLDDVKAQKFDAQLLTHIDETIGKLNQKTNLLLENGMADQYLQAQQWSSYMLDQVTPDTINPKVTILTDTAIRTLVNERFQGAMFSERIGLITDGMAQDIKDGLLQSMISGETMGQAADRVDAVIGDGSTWANRAEMIARTEIMRAQNLGRSATYEQNADLMDGTEWVATGDDRVCPSCGGRDGKTDEEIQAGIEDDEFDGSIDTPLHPNCRCTKAPKLKSWRDLGVDMPEDWADDARGYRDEDTGKWRIAPVQNFDDWRQDKLPYLEQGGGGE